MLHVGVAGTRADNTFIQEPLRILLPSDLGTLEALLVRPNAPGRIRWRYIAHGSPRSAAERPDMTPLACCRRRWIRRRRWAALMMRRGYGNSDGGWAETRSLRQSEIHRRRDRRRANLKLALGLSRTVRTSTRRA